MRLERLRIRRCEDSPDRSLIWPRGQPRLLPPLAAAALAVAESCANDRNLIRVLEGRYDTGARASPGNAGATVFDKLRKEPVLEAITILPASISLTQVHGNLLFLDAFAENHYLLSGDQRPTVLPVVLLKSRRHRINADHRCAANTETGVVIQSL